MKVYVRTAAFRSAIDLHVHEHIKAYETVTKIEIFCGFLWIKLFLEVRGVTCDIYYIGCAEYIHRNNPLLGNI